MVGVARRLWSEQALTDRDGTTALVYNKLLVNVFYMTLQFRLNFIGYSLRIFKNGM